MWAGRKGGKKEGRKNELLWREKEEAVAIYTKREVPDIGASKKRRTVMAENERIGFMSVSKVRCGLWYGRVRWFVERCL